MAVLFKFRANNGLESEIMFKIASIPDSEFAMCSRGTVKQGKAYQEIYYANVGDTRPFNYYPMLDNLAEWIQKTYEEK